MITKISPVPFPQRPHTHAPGTGPFHTRRTVDFRGKCVWSHGNDRILFGPLDSGKRPHHQHRVAGGSSPIRLWKRLLREQRRHCQLQSHVASGATSVWRQGHGMPGRGGTFQYPQSTAQVSAANFRLPTYRGCFRKAIKVRQRQ